MLRKMGKHAAVVAIVVAASAALVATSAADMTVGRFVQDLARLRNLTATDPQMAAASLAAAGIRLPAGLDLSAPLTEGDVTKISRAAGLKINASDPAATFSTEQADQFFGVFAGDLSGSDSGISTRSPGDCVLTGAGECAQPGAVCTKSGKTGFCQPANGNCTCNTGQAKGKRKQVVTPGEPE